MYRPDALYPPLDGSRPESGCKPAMPQQTGACFAPGYRRKLIDLSELSKTTDVINQWASKVLNVSSEYDQTNWCAEKILGKPQVYPAYGDLPGTWASGECDANQFIEVQFERPVYITQVDLYETYHAGAVKTILAQADGKEWEPIYTATRVEKIEKSRIFTPKIKAPSYMCRNLRIEIDCTVSETWCEIDAVQLYGRLMNIEGAKPPKFTLAADLESLVNNPQYSDVSFKVKGTLVHGHKAILCSRSSFFQTLLARKPSNPVDIPDLSLDSFVAVLYFLYTNSIPDDYTCVQMADIWRVANRFCIDGLKDLAICAIITRLTVDNVVDVFVSADSIPPVNKSLREYCLVFMSRNMDNVSKTSSFVKLPQQVMLDIVQESTAKMKL